jgi:hypothetical protein
MAIFTKRSAKAFDKAAKTVGTYLGTFNGVLNQMGKDVDKAPLSFLKRRAAKSAINKMRKAYKKEDKAFTAVIEELGKLGPHLSEPAFIEKCEAVERTIIPLFVYIKTYSDEIYKIINLVNLTIKPKEA